jgi:hypothetical protein
MPTGITACRTRWRFVATIGLAFCLAFFEATISAWDGAVSGATS